MKERPILFSAPMVRAILEGRKTQTRRVMKPQPTIDGGWYQLPNYAASGERSFKSGAPFFGSCPYGKSYENDLLWIRETHSINDFRGADVPEGDRADCEILYRATDANHVLNLEDDEGLKWRPSIHMPRWASRITLEITDVRVERLQEISEADAIAEGVIHAANCGNGPIYHPSDEFVGTPTCNPIYAYGQLWERINGSKGPMAWAANPWVWVVEFQRIKP